MIVILIPEISNYLKFQNCNFVGAINSEQIAFVGEPKALETPFITSV